MKLPILKKCFLGGGQGAALHLRFEFASFLSRRIDKPHILRYNQITFCTALHSAWNASSTVQTEQAMALWPWGRAVKRRQQIAHNASVGQLYVP